MAGNTPARISHVPYTIARVACVPTADSHSILPCPGLSILQVVVWGRWCAQFLLQFLTTASWMCAWGCSTAVLLLYLCILGLEVFVTGAQFLVSEQQ